MKQKISMKTRRSEQEMIMIIAEFLTNEFSDVRIKNVVDKSKRLYKIMKLEKTENEMQVERINKDLKKISKR